MIIVQVIGLVVLWGGVVFSALGVLGMMRFPDVYSRLHASGKVSTLGLCGLLIGASCLMPSLTLKAIALGIFLVMTAPVASHAIALAAYRMGVPLYQPVQDVLAAHQRTHPQPAYEQSELLSEGR
jgi:multicomponent Na+:H+ antiporter subunit G